MLVLSCMGTVLVSANNNGKDAKDSSKISPTAKPETVWNAKQLKAPLKRETLPISSVKLSGGKSSETLRTASQNLFGYNGQGGNGAGGFGGNGYNGFGNNGFGGGGGQFGFAPSYINGGGAGGRVGQQGFNQYSQLGNQAYNVLDQQNQGGFFGAAQGQNPYYSNNYFGGGGAGGVGGFGGGYNPYNSAGGVGGVGGGYPFGNQQGGGFGGFGGFGNQGYYPGAQYNQGQVGQRNFGFVNQGFGNPAFRNPQGGAAGTPTIPSNVQVGTGLDVGSRGFSGNGANAGGFPAASGQQYIVGNGIGQPAFIGGAAAPGTFGFGSPYGGMYSGGIAGGLYRQQSPNSIFGLQNYPRALSGTPSPASITSRPNSPTRLQTSGPNRFYQGVGPAGTYAPNSRERLYRFTSSNEN